MLGASICNDLVTSAAGSRLLAQKGCCEGLYGDAAALSFFMPVSLAALGVKIPKGAERHVTVRPLGCGLPNDDVINHIDLEQLASPDQITGDFDVGIRWSRIATGM